jgi:hypothetical protein
MPVMLVKNGCETSAAIPRTIQTAVKSQSLLKGATVVQNIRNDSCSGDFLAGAV